MFVAESWWVALYSGWRWELNTILSLRMWLGCPSYCPHTRYAVCSLFWNDATTTWSRLQFSFIFGCCILSAVFPPLSKSWNIWCPMEFKQKISFSPSPPHPSSWCHWSSTAFLNMFQDLAMDQMTLHHRKKSRLIVLLFYSHLWIHLFGKDSQDLFYYLNYLPIQGQLMFKPMLSDSWLDGMLPSMTKAFPWSTLMENP